MPLHPSRFHRGVAATALGAWIAAAAWVGHAPPHYSYDFPYFWVAGHAVAHDKNPYEAVLERVERGELKYPLYYPGTAAVLLSPFGIFPIRLAHSLFAGLGLGTLAWTLTRRRWWPLAALASYPVFQVIVEGQSSLWTTAGIGLPWLGGLVWAAKPSIGIACFAGWPSRRAVLAGAAIVVVATLLIPTWPRDWLNALHGAPYWVAPLFRPLGWVLLLAWIRWRSPEARLLGVLSLIPHTTAPYETLPLLLAARRPWQLAVLLVGGWIAFVLLRQQPRHSDVVSMLADAWPVMLACCYLPALAFVLWPHEAPPTTRFHTVSDGVDSASQS